MNISLKYRNTEPSILKNNHTRTTQQVKVGGEWKDNSRCNRKNMF